MQEDQGEDEIDPDDNTKYVERSKYEFKGYNTFFKESKMTKYPKPYLKQKFPYYPKPVEAEGSSEIAPDPQFISCHLYRPKAKYRDSTEKSFLGNVYAFNVNIPENIDPEIIRQQNSLRERAKTLIRK